MSCRPAALLAALLFRCGFCYQLTRFDNNLSASLPAERLEENNINNKTLALLERLKSGVPSPADIYNALASSVPDDEKLEGGKTLLQHWLRLQSKLTAAFPAILPKPKQQQRRLKTLVVMPAGSSQETVENFGETLAALKGPKAAGDAFHFALFHYHFQEPWLRKEWYNDERIVFKRVQHGCKAQFWLQISEDMVKDYDYIWLMDDDVSLSTFSWPLYRQVLLALEPIVSQPAIVARDVGNRSSDWGMLQMYESGQDNSFNVAREVPRTEVMAPILSTRIWPAMLTRLRGSDCNSAWYFSDFWDIAALAAARKCGTTGPLVVNASPLRHLNKHNLLVPGGTGVRNSCYSGCGREMWNCQPLKSTEKKAIAAGLEGVCDLGEKPLHDCWQHIRQCLGHMSKDQVVKTWEVKHRGP